MNIAHVYRHRDFLLLKFISTKNRYIAKIQYIKEEC